MQKTKPKTIIGKIKREFERLDKRRTKKIRDIQYAKLNTMMPPLIHEIHVYYVDLMTKYIQTTSAEIAGLHKQVEKLQTEMAFMQQREGIKITLPHAAVSSQTLCEKMPSSSLAD